MSGGEEGDYWPGYVDALTSMVQVLTFVMMLLAMAVFILSQNTAKSAVEAVAKATKTEISPTATIDEIVKKLVEKFENQEKTPPVEVTKEDKEKHGSTPPSSVDDEKDAKDAGSKLQNPTIAMRVDKASKIADKASRVTLTFSPREHTLSKESLELANNFITQEAIAEGNKQATVRVYASSDDASISEARRLAYYRALIIRKALIEKKVPSQNIVIRVFDVADKEQGLTADIVIGAGE